MYPDPESRVQPIFPERAQSKIYWGQKSLNSSSIASNLFCSCKNNQFCEMNGYKKGRQLIFFLFFVVGFGWKKIRIRNTAI
jgi:hypothetical protein